MAYRRRTSTRRRSYSGSRSGYRTRATRSTRRRSTRRVSARRPRQQTVRIVVQTVPGSLAANQSAIAPLRAMF